METNQKLPAKIAYAPGIANAALQFVYSVSGSYITFFITDICMLGALVMGAISFIGSIATLISIFLWGAVFQYSNTKSGRYRPWIMGLITIVFIGYSMLYYHWGLAPGLWAVLIIIGYSLANIGVSGIGVASMSLTATIATTEHERARMVTFQNLTHIIVRVVSSAIVLPIIIFVGGSKTAPSGYFAYFAGFSLLSVLGYFYLYRATKNYDVYDPNFKSGTKKVTLSDMVKTLGVSPKLLLFWISEAIYELFYICKLFASVYFLIYICGSLTYFAVYMTLNPLAALGGAAITSLIIKKVDKIHISLVSFSIEIVMIAIVAILAYSGSINTILFSIFMLIGDCVNSSQRATIPIFYMDLAEYTYSKTNKNVTPIVMAMAGVPFKFAFGASASIVGLVLANTGYVPMAVQTATAINGIIFAECIIPIIGLAQFCVMLLTGYKLNKEKVEKLYAENAEKRAAINSAQ